MKKDSLVHARIESLSRPQAKEFCTRLWLELTIAGRSIWSDDQYDQQTQISALKWLNEIQHRVQRAYVRNDSEALSWLLERTISHCKECPAISGHVRVALDRSLAAVAPAKPDVFAGSAAKPED
jgi:hypothetical protein